MRVLSIGNLYLPHAPGGGYEITWRSAVEHLRRGGTAVRVLTTDHVEPGAEGAPEDPDIRRELRWYWREHAFPRLSLRERLALERHNLAVLERELAAFQPDVVNWWGLGGMSLSLVEAVRRAGLPAVGVVGDEWMVWGPRADGWQRPLRRSGLLAALAERLTGVPSRIDLGGAATWLFNSHHVLERVRGAGVELPAAAVLHPGIEQELFAATPERDWGWRLACVGRLDPRKGTDLAVRALALLPPEATLVLVGSGDPAYAAELRALAQRAGLAERVRLESVERARIPQVYADADALLFPVQWEEPWGLVPLEAMAVGRPVVASGTGGSAEYLEHGENALVYEPRSSPEALAAAVRRLAEDAALRARLRAGGLATAARFGARDYDEGIERALRAAAGAPL